MPDIKANLSAISKEIKDIEKSAKDAGKSAKNLANEIRLDPTNVKTLQQRFAALDNELEETNKLVATLQQKQNELKGIDTKTLNAEEIKKVNKLLDQLRIKLDYATQRQKELSIVTDKGAQNQQIIATATKKAEEAFGKYEKAAEKVAVALVAVVAGFVRLGSQMLEQGVELTALATRYNTNVESIQNWNRALYIATGQSNLFTNSLSVMSKGMAQIAAGRGIAYQQALKNIGVAYKDISDASTAEQFNTIVEALGNVENASARSEAALTLLGDSGQYIAGIFEQDNANIDEYLERAKSFAVITTENAEKMKELSIELEASKSQLQVIGAEVLIALLPLFQTFADVVKALSPLIKWFAESIGDLGAAGQILLVSLGLLIVALPKIISFFIALKAGGYAAAGGLTAVGKAATVANVALGKWQIILTAIAAVVLLVTTLIGALVNKTNEANDAVNNMVGNAQGILGNMGGEFTANTQSIATTQTEQSINITADIYGHGDTDISDEAAMKTAQLTADAIQKTLGDLIKG